MPDLVFDGWDSDDELSDVALYDDDEYLDYKLEEFDYFDGTHCVLCGGEPLAGVPGEGFAGSVCLGCLGGIE